MSRFFVLLEDLLMAYANLVEKPERDSQRPDAPEALNATSPTASGPSPEELLRQVQAGMKGIKGIQQARNAIKMIIECDHWLELKDQNGQEFTTFGQFAISPEPYGLDARGQGKGDILRQLLKDLNLHGAWLLYLRHEKRPVGRQQTNTADGEVSDDVYKPRTGSNSIDERLRQLNKKSPDIAQQLIRREITFKKAEIKAGLKKPPPFRYAGVFQSAGFMKPDFVAQMEERDKSSIVRQLSLAMNPDTAANLLVSIREELFDTPHGSQS